MITILMAVAGGLGAGARFVTDGVLTTRSRWTLPIATLVINVTGSFLLGLVVAWATRGGPDLVLVVAGMGFLGGFTTFSTASVELVRLVRAERPLAAVGLALTMLVLAVLAGFLGAALG